MANLLPLTVTDNALRRVLLNQNLNSQKAGTSDAVLLLTQQSQQSQQFSQQLSRRVATLELKLSEVEAKVALLERKLSEVEVDTFGVVVEIIND